MASAGATTISTPSTIVTGDVNPSVVITMVSGADTFTTLLNDSVTITTDNTNLSVNTVTRDGNNQLTVALSGTAAPGMITLTVVARAFTKGNAASSVSLVVAPPASTSIFGESLSISTAAASISVGETATTSITHTWQSSTYGDSLTVTANCDGPSDCSGQFGFYWSASADSSTSTSLTGGANTSSYIDRNYAGASGTVRSVVSMKLVVGNTMKAGTYRVTVYSKTRNNGIQNQDKRILQLRQVQSYSPLLSLPLL